MTDRPFVWANCAVSLDGRLAYAHGRRARLSGPEDLRRVHALRAECQAIVVGLGTVRADDPSLLVKWDMIERPEGPAPLRVVLDSRGRTPATARVLDHRAPTLIATASAARPSFPPHVQTFSAGAERVDLTALLEELQRRGHRRILVEGGGEVLAAFFRAHLVDRFTVYVASVLIGGRTAPTLLGGEETDGPDAALPLDRGDAEPLDTGWLLTYRPRDRPGPPS